MCDLWNKCDIIVCKIQRPISSSVYCIRYCGSAKYIWTWVLNEHFNLCVHGQSQVQNTQRLKSILWYISFIFIDSAHFDSINMASVTPWGSRLCYRWASKECSATDRLSLDRSRWHNSYENNKLITRSKASRRIVHIGKIYRNYCL